MVVLSRQGSIHSKPGPPVGTKLTRTQKQLHTRDDDHDKKRKKGMETSEQLLFILARRNIEPIGVGMLFKFR